MKIIQSQNNEGSKFSQRGVVITFRTRNFVPIGSYVKLSHEGKDHHFQISTSITSPFEDIPGASANSFLTMDAYETGYHGSKFKENFDPRALLEKEVILVTDVEEIKNVRKEASYC